MVSFFQAVICLTVKRKAQLRIKAHDSKVFLSIVVRAFEGRDAAAGKRCAGSINGSEGCTTGKFAQ